MTSTGNPLDAPIQNVWSQIDFRNGGRVVAFVHSHPPMYNASSVANPIFGTATLSGTLSHGDFQTLLNISQAVAPLYSRGYDNVNFRQYLVTGAGTREFYASDQNAAYINTPGQATWAVQSSDYAINTSQPTTN
jgi:hypothetical protein